MRLVPLQVWEFETHLYWNLLWRLTEHDAFQLQRFSLRLFCNVMDRLQSQFSQGHPVDVWTALNEDVLENESIMDHPHDLKCKIVVVGDTQCGKTSLLSVFAKDSFPEVGLKSSLAFALYFSRLYGSYSEFRCFMNAKHKPKWIFYIMHVWFAELRSHSVWKLHGKFWDRHAKSWAQSLGYIRYEFKTTLF